MAPADTHGARPVGALAGALVVATAMWAPGAAADPGRAPVVGISGSRVRIMVYDGGGGAALFGGWFDAEFGARCVFIRTRNGQMRCLPAEQPAVWMDATCTMPVWRDLACGAPPPARVTALVPGGGAAYALAERYTGAVRNTSGGICLDSYARSGDWFSFYGTGAEIPSERFVAAAIRMAPIDDGWLVLRTLQGDDGSSQASVEIPDQIARAVGYGKLPPGNFEYFGSGRLRVASYVDALGQAVAVALGEFFDTQTGERCFPVHFADGIRCVPRGARYGGGCTTLRTGDSQWAPVTERIE